MLPTKRRSEAYGGPALTARTVKCSQGCYTCMKLALGVTDCVAYIYCKAMADLCN